MIDYDRSTPVVRQPTALIDHLGDGLSRRALGVHRPSPLAVSTTTIIAGGMPAKPQTESRIAAFSRSSVLHPFHEIRGKMVGMPTVRDVLDANRGTGPGFDFWRFFLSGTVIFLHSFHVSYGLLAPQTLQLWSVLRVFFMAVLPIFFGLSGFLVAGSAIRTKGVGIFLGFRALRLLPALIVETTLAALILGPIMTSFGLHRYFTDKSFYGYFGSIVGRVRYSLPGVFLGNPNPGTVNQNLWTLDAELACYGIMAIVIASRLIRFPKLLLAAWASATFVMAVMNLRTGLFEPPNLYDPEIFVYAFCTGVVAYVWSGHIPVSRWLAFAASLTFGVLALVPHTVFLMVPLLIYIMIWVGLQSGLKWKIFKKGDYSYGLYLYGYVIQQSLAEIVPASRHWYIMFPASLLLTLLFAALSWHIVEKPALRLKKYIAPKIKIIPSATEPAAA